MTTYTQLREAGLAANGALVIITTVVAVFHPPQPMALPVAALGVLNFLTFLLLDYVPRKEC